MKFAVNYSREAGDLVREGRIEVDYFKCPAWPDLIADARALRPVYVHLPLEVGRGIGRPLNTEANQAADWSDIETFLTETETPFVNLHLLPRVKHHPDIRPNSIDPGDVDCIVECVVKDVRAAVEHFGAERVIIENDNGGGGRLLHLSLLPAFVSRVVEEADCGFLFDLSHARMAAKELGIDAKEYIRALPLQRIREIHVTGLQYFTGQWLDSARAAGVDTETIDWLNGRWMDHLPMTEQDWDWITWSVEQIQTGAWARPWTIAFEYGGLGWFIGAVTKKQVLLDQVPRLYDTITGSKRLAAKGYE
jgi:uncharacterized protein (UPF0276 family)